jgi:hypothetical protein
MFDDIEEDIGRLGPKDYPLGTFLVSVQMGNDAMQSPDDLASALELIATQVRNRMEYPLPIMDINGNPCGEWRIVPYGT